MPNVIAVTAAALRTQVFAKIVENKADKSPCKISDNLKSGLSAAFCSDLENQATIVYMRRMAKVSLIPQKSSYYQVYPIALMHLITGLSDPAGINKIKSDILIEKLHLSEPKGRFDGYAKNQERHYVTEGHHRMAVYKQTGEASRRKKLIKEGVSDENRNTPAGAVKMSKR